MSNKIRKPNQSQQKPDVLYSKADKKRVHNLFSLQIGFMKCIGQIPLPLQDYFPKCRSSLAALLAKIYCFTAIALIFNLAILFFKTTYDMLNTGTLEEITDALTLTIIYSFASFGSLYWLWRSTELVAFLKRINRKYRHHSLPGLSYVSSYAAYAKARKLSLCWLLSCIIGVTCWGLAPIITRTRTLPLKCWYPFDAMQPIVYEIIYLLQILGQLSMGLIFGNGSAVFVSLVMVILGQFDVLFCSLKNLDFHAQIMAGEDLRVLRTMQERLLFGEEDELNQYIFAVEQKTNFHIIQKLREINSNNNNNNKSKQSKPTLQLMLHETLVDCVHLHRFVLESCIKLEELFHPYCLVKSLQITLQLCLLVFVAVAGELSLMRATNLIQYFALTFCELVMFTYCGELLHNHSVRVGEAFWRSQWWQNANLIRKDIMIFLVNTNRAVKLTAGKFYPMNIERLRGVMTQSFSFLTLLQKLAAKK